MCELYGRKAPLCKKKPTTKTSPFLLMFSLGSQQEIGPGSWGHLAIGSFLIWMTMEDSRLLVCVCVKHPARSLQEVDMKREPFSTSSTMLVTGYALAPIRSGTLMTVLAQSDEVMSKWIALPSWVKRSERPGCVRQDRWFQRFFFCTPKLGKMIQVEPKWPLATSAQT